MIGTQFSEAFAGIERMNEVFAESPEDAEEENKPPMPKVDGQVELRDLSFAYEEGKTVLHDINFTASPGTVNALVGPSGSGKSTLIGLIAAFYHPTSGVVLVDGRNLTDVRLYDYRKQLGVVLQENFLFAGTVRENLLYANPSATDAQIEDAARAAHCMEFISAFPDGFDTVIGERGVKLSGGQRQRLAIARALLADPRLLILDEATSALDSESEAYIQDALAVLMKGRTTFVIAHRLSTIRHADQILVLDQGRLVESGRHEDLLNARGRYFDMYTRQHGLDETLFLPPDEAPEEEEKSNDRRQRMARLSRIISGE
jgi:subfamily B ATP-binding cassette protein MsbA